MKGRHATRASTECNVLMTTASQAAAQVVTLFIRGWSHPKLVREPSRPHGLGKHGGRHLLEQTINQVLSVSTVKCHSMREVIPERHDGIYFYLSNF